MKSIVVTQPGMLQIIERDMPMPNSQELRIRIKHAGICGSDVHIYHGSNPFAQYPRVIGHEFFGVVDAVGHPDQQHLIGQAVVVDPVVSCGHCYACLHDKPNVCDQLSVIGVHQDGGFSEYVCVPTANIYTIPQSLPEQFASLIEPFAVAANITCNTKVYADDIALVYGAGPIGLMLTQVLKWVYGVHTVIVTDRLDERLQQALTNGADRVLNTATHSLEDYLLSHQLKPTLIIDAACHPDILSEAIMLAAPAARIGMMGFSSVPCTIIQQKITSKELAIFSSRLNSKKFPLVIEWIDKQYLKPELLVSHYFKMEEIQNALHIFEHQPQSCCKIILNFD